VNYPFNHHKKPSVSRGDWQEHLSKETWAHPSVYALRRHLLHLNNTRAPSVGSCSSVAWVCDEIWLAGEDVLHHSWTWKQLRCFCRCDCKWLGKLYFETGTSQATLTCYRHPFTKQLGRQVTNKKYELHWSYSI